jgi:cell division septation protein DedD
LEPTPTKPTPVPVSRPVAPAAPSGLYLQIAALKDSAAARELALELRTAGFETEILSPSDDGLIRVISGPYDKRNDARTAAKKMSGLGVQAFLREF